jgi:hypothetical protein
VNLQLDHYRSENHVSFEEIASTSSCYLPV